MVAWVSGKKADGKLEVTVKFELDLTGKPSSTGRSRVHATGVCREILAKLSDGTIHPVKGINGNPLSIRLNCLEVCPERGGIPDPDGLPTLD